MTGSQFFLCFAGLFQHFVGIYFLLIIPLVLFLLRALHLIDPSMYFKLSLNCPNYITFHLSLSALNLGKIKASMFSSAYIHTDFLKVFLTTRNISQTSFQKNLLSIRPQGNYNCSYKLTDTNMFFSELKHNDMLKLYYIFGLD